jgi:ABC-2 type transport system permease protein
MLADAIAAERFRLLRDRSALFWGFCFAPLVGLLLSVGGDLFVRNVIKKPMPGVTVDLVDQVWARVGGSSTFGALFLMIGAAAIWPATIAGRPGGCSPRATPVPTCCWPS